MFCPKCGKQVEGRPRFCPACGKEMDDAGAKDGAPKPTAASGVQLPFAMGSNPDRTLKPIEVLPSWLKALGVLRVIIVLLAFAPLVKINVLLFSGSYSFLDLASMVSKMDHLLKLGGGSFGLMLFQVVIVLWVAAIASSIWCAVRCFSGKSPEAWAAPIAFVFCLVAFAVGALFDVQLDGPAFTPSIWFFAMTILSLFASARFKVSEDGKSFQVRM